MPSFNVGAGSYKYFLSFHDSKYTENIDGDLNEKRTIPSFIKYTCSAAIFFLLMHLWHFCWDFLNAHYPDKYVAHKLYFEFDIVLLLWQSMFMTSFVILLTSVVHKDDSNMFHQIIILNNLYKLLQYITIILSLTAILSIPIIFLSFSNESMGNQLIFNITETDSICNLILCEYLYLRFLLIYVVYPCCVPSLLFTLWLLKFKCSKYTSKQASIQEEILLEHAINHDDATASSNSKNDLDRKQIIYPLLLLFLFSCSFVLSFIFGHIHGQHIQSWFELIYWSLCLYTQIFKFMTKWIALRCDEWRALNSKNNNLVSIEWLVEFYWDLTYWMIYRYYTIFDSPSVGLFVFTVLVHLSWEFCSVFVRLTPKYFKMTTYWTYNSIPLSCMDYIIDNCNYNEWKNRLAMDIVVKFGCSVCSGLFFFADIVVNLPLYRHSDDVELEDDIIAYFSISVVVELLFYLAMMIVQAKLYNYSISKPFVGYVKELTTKHRWFLLILYGSIVIPVY